MTSPTLSHLGLTVEQVRASLKTPVADAPKARRGTFDYKTYWANWNRARAAKFKAAGLNYRGKPYMRKQHPKLSGLDRKTYHRLYMQIWRGKDTAQVLGAVRGRK